MSAFLNFYVTITRQVVADPAHLAESSVGGNGIPDPTFVSDL